jgi:hypothetical protein
LYAAQESKFEREKKPQSHKEMFRRPLTRIGNRLLSAELPAQATAPARTREINRNSMGGTRIRGRHPHTGICHDVASGG